MHTLDTSKDAVERLVDELECSDAPIKTKAARLLRELRRERDEADRKVGVLTREVEGLRESERAHRLWTSGAKREAGFHENVSFDTVWAVTLQKAKRHDEIVRELGEAKGKDAQHA